MSEKIDIMTKQLDLPPGASEEVVRKAQHELGLSLPKHYIEWVTKTNGAAGAIGERSYIIFWPLQQIKSANEDYAVEEFAPGLLLFGSNGSSSAFAFDTRYSEMPIVEVPFIGMSYEEAKVVGKTLVDLFQYLFEKE